MCTNHTHESVRMAEAIGSSYSENQPSSKSTTDSDSSDDEYPDSLSTASARNTKLYHMYEMKLLKRNKHISRQERRRIQQEIQKGRKPGEPMTSLLSSFMLPTKRDVCPP